MFFALMVPTSVVGWHSTQFRGFGTGRGQLLIGFSVMVQLWNAPLTPCPGFDPQLMVLLGGGKHFKRQGQLEEAGHWGLGHFLSLCFPAAMR